jgi:hypothetical protein
MVGRDGTIALLAISDAAIATGVLTRPVMRV